MLDSRRLTLITEVPDFLVAAKVADSETFYCIWAKVWLDDSSPKWIDIAIKEMWHECDDTKNSVSSINYLEYIVKENQSVLENHFQQMSDCITNYHLPNTIAVSATKMKRIVIWGTR